MSPFQSILLLLVFCSMYLTPALVLSNVSYYSGCNYLNVSTQAEFKCPEICKCNWYFEEGYVYWVTVDCDNAGLNDSNLPALPDQTSRLTLNNNSV